jgi:predicted hotdog family 3-hydroxylacyl-ACP dehydratase
MPLSHDDIARRIPHQGAMCLLADASHWDENGIVCRADSHRAPNNPLRHEGRLGAACAIEYAAQAMALHGALCVGRDAPPRAGFLTSLRDVRLSVTALDDLADDLDVHVEKLMGDDNNVMYRFTVTAGALAVARGRAAVRLDAGRHLDQRSEIR